MFVLPKFMQDQSDSPYSALPLDDSDGQSSESQTSEIEFYADNDHLPIFKSGLQCGLSTSEIVNIIKGLDTDDKCVAKMVPTSVSHNVAFVIDVTSKFVGHVKNLLSDDMGAWNQTGTKTVYYECTSRGAFEVSSAQRHGENTYKVIKWYYRNNSSNDLSRIVCHMTGEKTLNFVHPYTITHTKFYKRIISSTKV